MIREPPRLLPLAAGAAVADTVDVAGKSGRHPHPVPASIKWPNDVLLGVHKIAGILVEGRPQEGWAVVGIGLNVAPWDFPPELTGRAGTLGLDPEAIEPTLETLLGRLEAWLVADAEAVLTEVRARDALLGRSVRWAEGSGRGDGIDGDGRLVVLTPSGRVTLNAGEVHLESE